MSQPAIWTGTHSLSSIAVSVCSIEGCPNPAQSRGWCGSHYGKWRRHGDPNWVFVPKATACSIDGCEGKGPFSKGLCRIHYIRQLTHGDPQVLLKTPGRTCSIDGCDRPHNARGLCHTHGRWEREGVLGEKDLPPVHRPPSVHENAIFEGPEAARLRFDYESRGLSSKQMGDREGVSHQAMLVRLHNAGAQVRPAMAPESPASRKMRLETAQAIRNRYLDYESVAELALAFDYTESGVRYVLKRAGVKLRPSWDERRR